MVGEEGELWNELRRQANSSFSNDSRLDVATSRSKLKRSLSRSKDSCLKNEDLLRTKSVYSNHQHHTDYLARLVDELMNE